MMLWWGSKKKGEERPASEGKRAFDEAKKNLEESMSDREDVLRISSFLRGERIENHLSARIDKLLREGR